MDHRHRDRNRYRNRRSQTVDIETDSDPDYQSSRPMLFMRHRVCHRPMNLCIDRLFDLEFRILHLLPLTTPS
jgi:hypothetical protein